MLKCPQCGNEATFKLDATTLLTVYQNATGALNWTKADTQGMEWDDDSLCTCARCGYQDRLLVFDDDEEEEAIACPYCADGKECHAP